ncbi:1-phosphatidylinositol phosphodiesterase-like [Gastrophryne carolinensis]
MDPKVKLLVCLLVVVVFGEQTPSFDRTDSPSITLPDWMSYLPDDLPLASLAIPGTHDTMAFYGGSLAECQSWSLLNQLRAGIRFLDIRPRHYQDRLPIFHGVSYQRTYFDQVLKDTVTFLTEHPSETVLMRVKEEHDPYQVTRSYYKSVAEVINQTGEHWFLKNSSLSTLGKARGKIIILQQFSSNGEGPNFGPLYPGDMSISDKYEVTDDAVKWAEVERHLEIAQDGDTERAYLTYSSGTHWLLYTPETLARKINPRVLNYLTINTSPARRRSVGVIIMDFPGANLVRQIILDNWV